jgi:surface protein
LEQKETRKVFDLYGDLSEWDVSNLTNMNDMFAFAWSFNGDLSEWNVSKVTNGISYGWLGRHRTSK